MNEKAQRVVGKVISIRTGVILCVVGLVFAAIAAVFLIRGGMSWAETDAEVLAIGSRYVDERWETVAHIRYTVNGIEYEQQEFTVPSTVREGETVRVTYSERDPSIVGEGNILWLMFLFLGVGAVAVVGGVVNIVRAMREGRQEKEDPLSGGQTYVPTGVDLSMTGADQAKPKE